MAVKLNLEKISVAEYKNKVDSSSVDSKTIYWLNNGTIYVGGQLYGGKIELIESDPTYPEMNVLYVNKNDFSMKTWNGVSYDYVNKGYSISITDDSDDTVLPTAKAVATYVQNKIGELPTSVGVTDIQAADEAILNVTKDGTTSPLTLTGVAYNPTWDSTQNKLTIPIGGKSDLVINFAKDTVVTAGKYNTETKEIWLTKADDKSYDNEDDVIKIPASDLVDIYTGKTTSTATTTVSTANEISVDIKISAESGNAISIKDDGLYVSASTSSDGKLDKVESAHVDEIITANADGTVKVSGKKVGGNTIVAIPDENTVATEIAVKSYADTVASNALESAKSYADNTTLVDAKNYADGLITWTNW